MEFSNRGIYINFHESDVAGGGVALNVKDQADSKTHRTIDGLFLDSSDRAHFACGKTEESQLPSLRGRCLRSAFLRGHWLAVTVQAR